MYFWNINGLIDDLRTNKVSTADLTIYAALLSLTLLLSLNVINILPLLYDALFSIAKEYLEKQTAPTSLTISVYDYYNSPFLNLKLAVVVVGIIFCFFINKGNIKQFLTRIIALSWPITFRIIVITGSIFLVIMALIGAYFGYKLLLITATDQKITGPKILKPLKMLTKATVVYPIGKTIWTQGQNLVKAQIIFDQISRASYLMYWFTHITAFFSTLWWMLRLQKGIRKFQ
jgi:hypothetical protein